VNATASVHDVVFKLRRRAVIFGAVPRGDDGRCKARQVTVVVPPDAGPLRHQYPVDGRCRFTADDLPRAGNATTLTINTPQPLEMLRSTDTSDGSDPEPVCFQGTCPAGVPDATLRVDVTGDRGALVSGARVQATRDRRTIGHCEASGGTCSIHHLVPGARVHLKGIAGRRRGEIDVTLSSGVNEALLPLSASR
jgi:hypothetical protein